MKLSELLKGLIGKASLLFIWLIIFGFISEQSGYIGLGLSVISVVAFFTIHVFKKYPKVEQPKRLSWRFPKQGWLLILASIVLVAGDIAWVIDQDNLQSTEEPNPLVYGLMISLAFPLAEEFGFRLWIQGTLETKIKPILALIITAFIFASLHSSQFPITQFFGGCMYGLALFVSKSVWYPILLHALQNGLLVSLGEFTWVKEQAWSLSEASPAWLFPTAISLWVLAGVISSIWLGVSLKSWNVLFVKEASSAAIN